MKVNPDDFTKFYFGEPDSFEDNPLIFKCLYCRKVFTNKNPPELCAVGHLYDRRIYCTCGERFMSSFQLKYHQEEQKIEDQLKRLQEEEYLNVEEEHEQMFTNGWPKVMCVPEEDEYDRVTEINLNKLQKVVRLKGKYALNKKKYIYLESTAC